MAILLLLHVMILVISNLLSFSSLVSSATDTVTLSQPLHDGTTLVSREGTFELGFFNPGNSADRYVGLWYKNIPDRKVVWVANRDNPIKNNNFSSNKLIINQDGNLVLLSQSQSQNKTLILWSTNATSKALNPVAQLLDDGNLVIKDENDDINNEQNFLWQSFDYPSDTLLAGMKFGWDKRTGLNRRFTAWKSWDDPSSGDLTSYLEIGKYPESVIWKGSVEYFRAGPSSGGSSSGIFAMKDNPIYSYKYIENENEVYYMYNLKNTSLITIVVLNQTLNLRQRLVWVPQTRTWNVYQSLPQDGCDAYNICGAFGNCVIDESPICQCLNGFKPKSPLNWNAMDWSQGCVLSEPWSCKVKDKDGFGKFSSMKVPDTRNSWVNDTMTLEDCRNKCMENCSCTAYGNLDPTGSGSGCAIWFGDLLDLRVSKSGQDLYVRMASSHSVGNAEGKQRHKKKVVVLAVTITTIFILVMLLALSFICKRKRKNREKKDDIGEEDLELPFFDLATIVNATTNFSDDNKLGEGGFGPVYKGILPDGQVVAIKRLSSNSGQGLKEFKNEVTLCSKLQHRNLVKIIGCCVEGGEKMLVYEFMANRSLDTFLFDSEDRSKLLDWHLRFNILTAIARGLLYLHQDSRLRIIHRDLKASNILLDNDMNPKISDFGLARMCGGDQIEGNTSRIAGTFGYMAPEYAIDGLFSMKSDVFSFGVLLLELVSGKKNKALIYHEYDDQNLIGLAWNLWKEGNLEKLIDARLGNSYILPQALHCIQIGLLCVQHNPYDRPNMASIVLMMLGSENNALPQPKEPGFLIRRVSTMEGEHYNSKQMSSSVNEVSVSLIHAR